MTERKQAVTSGKVSPVSRSAKREKRTSAVDELAVFQVMLAEPSDDARSS
jgi:hypothetical protein